MFRLFPFIILLLAGCSSVQYYNPIRLSNEDVSRFQIVDRAGQRRTIGPGKIRDCTVKIETGDCAYVVCKEDQADDKKLTCDWYMPKGPISARVDALINKEKTLQGRYRIMIDNIIDQLFEDYRQDPQKNEPGIAVFCQAYGVTCWKNSTMFPSEDFRKLTTNQVFIKRVVNGIGQEEFEIQISAY